MVISNKILLVIVAVGLAIVESFNPIAGDHSYTNGGIPPVAVGLAPNKIVPPVQSVSFPKPDSA